MKASSSTGPRDLANVREALFLGIGGAGMSALARHLAGLGVRVRGYDRSASEFTDLLVSAGIECFFEDDPGRLGSPDLVVYTPAVPNDLAISNAARGRGLELQKRSQVLGWLTRGTRTVAIAGTHGKTTTSTLTAHLLKEAGVPCGAFLGGISVNAGSNYIAAAAGSAEAVLVVEADEYDRSFLTLAPDTAVVTYTEADHLDIYGHADSVLQAYADFVALLPSTGHLIVRHGDPGRASLETSASRFSYGVDPEADCAAANLRVERGRYRFDYHSPMTTLRDLSLAIGGRHNVENATAALTAALLAGADPAKLPAALFSFLGVRRRFETLASTGPLVVVDDYAHHPTEIAAVIAAARELYPERRLAVLFQPHLFSRTRDFGPQFAEALATADRVSLLPIYPAREQPLPGVDSWASIGRLVPGAELIEQSLETYLGSFSASEEWLLLAAGAGSISDLLRRALTGGT